MTLQDMDPVDKMVMLASYALILVSTAVLGIVELFDGAPFGAAPATNDAGEVIATPLVPPSVRTGVFMLAIVILLIWGVYKVVGTVPEATEERAPQTAD